MTEIEGFEIILQTTSQSNVKAVTSDHSTQKKRRLHDLWLNISAIIRHVTHKYQTSMLSIHGQHNV